MNKPHDQPMPETEHAQLRAYLSSKGASAADILAAVGASAGGRTRLDVEHSLTQWLKARPKG